MRLLSVLIVLVLGLVNLQASDKPNIVFMIADDCTFRDIGCYGGQAQTPNIDALSEQGMRFTRCFQSAPMCSPTRHAIYTGLFPVKSGAYPNHTFVESGTKSLVQLLTPQGYRIAHSGKSHVSPPSVFAWEEIPGKKNPDFAKVDEFVGECAQKDTPFCLLLCSNEPHTPWDRGDASRYPPAQIELPAYFVDTPETRDGMSRYLAEITYFDSQVGSAMEVLEKHGLVENTLLIVVSEQGSSMPFAKWTCYDSGLQSACIARWPGIIAPGTVNPAMIEYVDFLPTFLEVAGAAIETELDGRSLMPVFEGKQTHKSFVFGEMTTRGVNNGSDHYGIRSVRSDNYKYIWNFSPEVTFQNACTNSPEFESWVALAKSGNAEARNLVSRYTKRPKIELYDVRSDPLEMVNLADDPQYDGVLIELRSELDEWMKKCGDAGPQTEMEALEHMTRNRDKKSAKQK